MALQAEMITEQRRLRRRLGFWRFTAVIVVLAAVTVFLIGLFGGTGGQFAFRDHVARVTIDGIITDDLDQQDLLEKIAKSDRAKALLLRINSPGGTTTGAEALFASIREVAAKKPVVAVLGTVAASGGYVAALGADRIVSRGNTITGSIGVILQWAEVSELLTKVGVKVEEVKSGPLKGQPSFTGPTTEAGRAAARAMVLDSYDWFVNLVSDRRGMDAGRARGLADGRVFTGRQAVEENLVDAIGGEDEARAWLKSEHQIDTAIETLDWRPDTSTNVSLIELAARALAGQLGAPGAALSAIWNQKTSLSKRLSLDGLISVWHPD